MDHEIHLENASADIVKLIQKVRGGEEIVITENSLPVAKVVPVETGKPYRKAGSAKRRGVEVHISEDFDAPLEEFRDYM